MKGLMNGDGTCNTQSEIYNTERERSKRGRGGGGESVANTQWKTFLQNPATNESHALFTLPLTKQAMVGELEKALWKGRAGREVSPPFISYESCILMAARGHAWRRSEKHSGDMLLPYTLTFYIEAIHITIILKMLRVFCINY